MNRHPKIQTIAVAVLMVALAGIFTYPLMGHFNEAIPFAREGGGELPHKISGDHLQVYYWFWLLKDNLLGPSALFTNPYEFNMIGGQVPQGLNMFPLSALYVLFTPLGDVAAYNMLVILSFVLAGVFMFLLIRQWFGSAAAGVLGAAIFALSPFRVSQMAGAHLNGFIFFLYPMVFYLIEGSLRRRSLWWAAGSCAAIFSVVLMEHHLTYYLFVLLGIYVPFRVLVWCRSLRAEAPVAALSPVEQRPRSAALRMTILATASALPVVWFQAAVAYHQDVPFWSPVFIAALGLYWLLFLGLFLLESVAWDLLVPVGSHRTLAMVALGTLPLLILALYALQWLAAIPHFGLIVAGTACAGALTVRIVFVGGHRRLLGTNLVSDILPALPRFWRTLVPLMATAGVSVAYVFYMKSRLFTGSIVQGGRRLGEVALYTPHLEDIWLRTNPLMERYLYPGLVPAAAVLMALWLLLQRLSDPTREPAETDRDGTRLAAFFFFILAISYILSLGLGLRHLSLYQFFFFHFPYFNYPRVPGRMMIVVAFSLAVMAGYAVSRLQQARPHAKWLGAVLAATTLVLVAVDYHPFKPMAITRLYPNPIYETVKADIGDGFLLELPLWPGDSHQSALYEYYTTLDGVRRVNGYSPVVSRAYIETVFKPLESLNQGRLDQQQADLLNRMHVRYITVHDNTDVFPSKVSPDPPKETVRRLKRSPFLEFVGQHSHIYLFRLKGRSDGPSLN